MELSTAVRSGLSTFKAARVTAWVVLLFTTGLLVRGESPRGRVEAGMRVDEGVTYKKVGARIVRLDVLTPLTSAPARGWPTLIAVHGGGWRGGGRAEYGRSLAPLVREGFAVVSVDYRLSRPGSPSWPENLDDVRAAIDWVEKNASHHHFDRRRIALIGASAGGHLALLAAHGDTHSRRGNPISAVIDFYAPADLPALVEAGTPANRSIDLMLGPGRQHRGALLSAASPVSQISSGGPPVLILHGDEDALIPVDQSKSLKAALDGAGVASKLVIVPGSRHGFGLMAGSTDLVPEIVAFLDRAWGAG